MKRKPVIGVMGGGSVSEENLTKAYRLGCLIAENGWILLNGGRDSGIMGASARGAFEKGGLTIGILPDENDERVSPYISVPIITGMGNARNCINVLSADLVVACPGGAGTVSEIALALKSGKPVILFDFDTGTLFQGYRESGQLISADSPEAVVEKIRLVFRKESDNKES